MKKFLLFIGKNNLKYLFFIDPRKNNNVPNKIRESYKMINETSTSNVIISYLLHTYIHSCSYLISL